MDVWKNSSCRNGDRPQQSIKLLIILHGKRNVTGDNAALLVISSSVSGQFEDFRTKVLQDSRQIDWGSGAHVSVVLKTWNVRKV